MTYRELLQRYQEGTLDEEQRQQVASSIEQQEAISDFLWDRDLPEEEEPTLPEEAPELTASIQKTIRRTFLKLGVTVGLAVLALTLCAVFLLPKVVDQFYYRPNEIAGVGSEPDLTTSRMSLDLAVWSELFLPGRFRETVTAVPRGYGVYDIAIPQTISADGRFRTEAGTLVRNRLQLYNPDFLSPPVGNAFLLPEGKEETFGYAHMDNETSEILPYSRAEVRAQCFRVLQDRTMPGQPVIAYVSFETLQSYEDTMAFLNRYDLLGCAWGGVYAEAADGHWLTENTGMRLDQSGILVNWDRDRYPALSFLGSTDEELQDEALPKTHFLSLMQYLEDHEEMVEVFGRPGYHRQTSEIRAYVEENGLQFYGVAVITTAEDLLQLEQEPLVSQIHTTPY